MIVLIRKKSLVRWIGLCCLCAVLFFIIQQGREKPGFSACSNLCIGDTLYTIVLDAGHGGEDGGAVSTDGTRESQLNLEIAVRMRDLFLLTGQPVQMIREDDRSLDSGEGTLRQRKAADLKNRVLRVNQIPNAVFISIHQNSLPSSPVTHGAQVFWNAEEGAQELAESIQDALNVCINLERAKQPRKIPASVYLMKHITAPGVLIECGFLSNPEETARLKESTHQIKLAVAITAGYLKNGSYIAEEEEP